VGGYDALHDGTGAEFRVHVGPQGKGSTAHPAAARGCANPLVL